MKLNIICTLLFLIDSYHLAHSQTKYKLVIHLPRDINRKNLNIILSDGKTPRSIPLDSKSDSTLVSWLFFGKYASVSIGYYSLDSSSLSKGFFINGGNSRLELKLDLYQTLLLRFRRSDLRM